MIAYNKRTNQFDKLGFKKVTELTMERLNKRENDVNRKVKEGIAVHTFFEVFLNSKTYEVTIYCDKRIHNYVLAGIMKFYKSYTYVPYEAVLERKPEEPEPVPQAEPEPEKEPEKIMVDHVHINLGKWDNYPTGAPERLDGVEIVLHALSGAKAVFVRFDYDGLTRHAMAAQNFVGLLREMGYADIDYELDFEYVFKLTGSPKRSTVSYKHAIEKVKQYGRIHAEYGGEVVLLAKYARDTVDVQIIVQSDARVFREFDADNCPIANREFPLETIKKENADLLIHVMGEHLKDIADGLFYRFYVQKITV